MPRKTLNPAGAALLALFLLLALPQTVCALSQASLFIYHRFADPRHPSTDIAAEDFKAHLDILQREGFAVVTLERVVASLEGGAPLPERCAVITVDDAYRSFLTVAWPLLKHYGYPATLFVSTDNVGGGDFLNWEELRQLRDEGVEIGNHSASHGHLLERLAGESEGDWEKRVSADILRGQQALAAHLGAAPDLFAYPYGEYSAALASLVQRFGFRAAFGQQSGVVTISADRFRLPRFPVGGSYAGVAAFRDRLFLRALVLEGIVADSLYSAAENPPRLRFRLLQEGVDPTTLRCFVPGQPDCNLQPVVGEEGAFEAVAVQPLAEQRSKYTLTASDRQGRTWYWYSHLWVREGR